MDISANIQKLSDTINELENLLKQCKEDLANLSKSNKAFAPNDGDFYYYVTSDGRVEYERYQSYYELDVSRQILGNCFETYDEADGIADKVIQIFTQNKGE